MDDLLSIYERQDAEAVARVCAGCGVAHDAVEGGWRNSRTIQIITGPDTHERLPCPICRSDEFDIEAPRHGWNRFGMHELRRQAERRVAAATSRADSASAPDDDAPTSGRSDDR